MRKLTIEEPQTDKRFPQVQRRQDENATNGMRLAFGVISTIQYEYLHVLHLPYKHRYRGYMHEQIDMSPSSRYLSSVSNSRALRGEARSISRCGQMIIFPAIPKARVVETSPPSFSIQCPISPGLSLCLRGRMRRLHLPDNRSMHRAFETKTCDQNISFATKVFDRLIRPVYYQIQHTYTHASKRNQDWDLKII